MKKVKFIGAPWWDARFEFFGNEQMPLLVIDNFFPQPDILIQDAKNKTFSANAPYYPGIRAAVPGAYFKPLMAGLTEALMSLFRYEKGIDVQECHYSLTTMAGTDLNMVQRIPHVDGGNDMKIALLHYLCGQEHGGTAFYRQCRTNFETVSSARFDDYTLAVHQDHEYLGAPKASYFKYSDKRFEQTHKVEAKFNRAILYFGLNLHSIVLGQKPLSENPETGRLTVNTFLSPL